MFEEREAPLRREVPELLRGGKEELLRRWEASLGEAGLPGDVAQRVRRALRPALDVLIDRMADLLGETEDSLGCEYREDARQACSFEEGLRGFSVFRALLAESIGGGAAPLAPHQLRRLLATTDDCATQVVSRLHESDVEGLTLFRARFVAALGHDLRNPLNAILLNARALMRHGAEAREIAYAQQIARSARRMDRMVCDILETASATSGAEAVVLAREETTLAAVCAEALEEMRATNPSRSIVFEPLAEGPGRWDRDRLVRAIENLVGNALLHGRADTAVVVGLREQEGEARISVRNEGAAIDAATRSSMFEPFVRGAATEGSPGLGLGLFIARAIARAHGGDIEVESSCEAGTTFTIVLPSRVATRSARPRALVVDDDRAVGAVMKQILETMGFDASAAPSGEVALREIGAGQRFELVVSDVEMPGMDGPAFLAAARAAWPDVGERFVFVSGFGATERTASTGVPRFAKPVGRDFYQHLERVLASARVSDTELRCAQNANAYP
jgi:signal transduction histidine kinase/CheY-like chemotaxis protein